MRLFRAREIAVGRENGAIVVPLGIARQTLPRQWEHPPPLDRDQGHLGEIGSSQAACVSL